MSEKKKGSVLGRGLGNLLSVEPDIKSQKDAQGIVDIDITKIKTNEQNPRKNFDTVSIKELSQTIKEHGLLQPILVLSKKNYYSVISGERRLRACRLLNLKTVPCVIKKYSGQQILEVSLIENIQREQLDVIEEARVYKNLLEQYSLTQEELSARVGKNRTTIANRVRLLQLPWELQTAIADHRLTEGQVRPLLSLKNDIHLKKIANLVLSKNLSARQVEGLMRDQKKTTKNNKTQKTDPNIVSLQDSLQETLGLRVNIRHNQQEGKGKITLEYFTLDDLDRIIKQLGNNHENKESI